MARTRIEYGHCAVNACIGCDNPASVCAVSADCWARGFSRRRMGVYGTFPKGTEFAPRFLPDRLDEPRRIRKPSRILVCFMGDLFCPGRPADQIRQVIEVAKETPWHSHIFLTKNPRRYSEFEFPENAWLGTTVTGSWDTPRFTVLMDAVAANGAKHTWLSYEPALGPLSQPTVSDLEDFARLDWLVIGGLANRPDKPPGRNWVIQAMDTARNAGVFMKANLRQGSDPAKWAWPGAFGELIQEYPEGMVSTR